MSSRIRTDWLLFSLILAVLAFGLVMVYSSSSVIAETLYRKETWEFAARQVAAATLGIILLLMLKRLDYRKLHHPLWVLLPLSLTMILLLGVIFADQKAHRWYRVPGLGQFQPSEIAKPVLILFLAYFVARHEHRINSRYTLIPTALVVGGLTLLIGYGDLGTAAVLLAPAVVVFYVAGIERRYFYLSLVLMAFLAAGFVYQKPYRIIRVTSFFGLTEQKIAQIRWLDWLSVRIAASKAARDADHQPRQAKIAVGSGGVTGTGLGLGSQKRGFLPEVHTDFIFGAVGEETGLIGCVTLLGAYLLIFWRGLRLYWHSQDIFGRYLALGCVSIIAAQALVNMTVVLDMAPTKGIPLPLISFGGSAVICTLATLGMLLSVSDRAN